MAVAALKKKRIGRSGLERLGLTCRKAVRRQLERLRVGQVVHLTGFLVDGVCDDGAYIHTSMTRSDTGPGACEVMLVEQVDVEQANAG